MVENKKNEKFGSTRSAPCALRKGIYIMANDGVIEQSISLLNSIRAHDRTVPVVMVPYDANYQKILEALKGRGVTLFPDLELIERLTKRIATIFGKKFFARAGQFRKQACWFGPFDEFLYLDTDIVVFEKVIDNLQYLSKNDFLCCDYQYLKPANYLFSEKILKDKVFTPDELKGVFNAGFWGAKKGLISEELLYGAHEECARHLDYFDFSQKVSDMPIFNYAVLKLIKRRFNIVRDTGVKGAGSWAGMPHFVREGNRLIDPNVNQPLKYLHWAGIKIAPGCPYYDVWEYYRHRA